MESTNRVVVDVVPHGITINDLGRAVREGDPDDPNVRLTRFETEAEALAYAETRRFLDVPTD